MIAARPRRAPTSARRARSHLPRSLNNRFNFRVGQCFLVFLSFAPSWPLCWVWSTYAGEPDRPPDALRTPFVKVFSLPACWPQCGPGGWCWPNRKPAHGARRIERQTQLLQKIDAHQRTDAALQSGQGGGRGASQAKTRYVAGMTHELRTPSTASWAIRKSCCAAARLQGSAREAVTTIQQSGQHMHALIDGLLDLPASRPDRLRLDQRRCPSRNSSPNSRAWCSPGRGQASRSASKPRAAYPLWVQTDAKRLRQILINLLGNAVRFTNQGAVVLRVDCRHEVVRFEVEDTGIGIAPQDQERIFQPFERAARTACQRSGNRPGPDHHQSAHQPMGGELTLRSAVGQAAPSACACICADQAPVARTLRHLRPIVGYLDPRRTFSWWTTSPSSGSCWLTCCCRWASSCARAASGRECWRSCSSTGPMRYCSTSTWTTSTAGRPRNSSAAMSGLTCRSSSSQPTLVREPTRAAGAVGCQGFVSKPVIESAGCWTCWRGCAAGVGAREQPAAIISEVPIGDAGVGRRCRCQMNCATV